MKIVRAVVAVHGAELTGTRVVLTDRQASIRSHRITRIEEDGVEGLYACKGQVPFKHGEQIGVDAEDLTRGEAALFVFPDGDGPTVADFAPAAPVGATMVEVTFSAYAAVAAYARGRGDMGVADLADARAAAAQAGDADVISGAVSDWAASAGADAASVGEAPAADEAAPAGKRRKG
jgi:hypothetical protein